MAVVVVIYMGKKRRGQERREMGETRDCIGRKSDLVERVQA